MRLKRWRGGLCASGAAVIFAAVFALYGCSYGNDSSGSVVSSWESPVGEQTQSSFEYGSPEVSSGGASGFEEPPESDKPCLPYDPGALSIQAAASDGSVISYVVDEKSACVRGNITYSAGYIPDRLITSAVIQANAERGVCFIDGKEGTAAADLTKSHLLKVVDENGSARHYTILTERTQGKLPIVSITLDDGMGISEIKRNSAVGMTISIDCSNASEYEKGFENLHGEIRGRGNSTWKWGKKPFKIKLDSKAEVLGLPANKDWILLANYADKSLIRNTAAFDMARVLSFDWTPTQYPVDLFINGEYRGVYSIGEHLEVAEDRVNITKKSDSPENFGYLVEVGGSENGVDVKGVDFFHTNSDMLRFVTFEEPEGNEITDEQRREIIDFFNAADDAIVNGGDIEKYIDMDSFVDWVIIQELTNNTDSAFRRSCFLTRDAGGKIKMGPVWDFDLAFGNYVIDNPAYNTWTIIGFHAEKAYVKASWGNYLMKNKAFRARLCERWHEKRGEILCAAFSSIDSYSQKILPSQNENFLLWQIWGKKVGFSSSANNKADSYELQIKYLKDFISNRAEWIDKNIGKY